MCITNMCIKKLFQKLLFFFLKSEKYFKVCEIAYYHKIFNYSIYGIKKNAWKFLFGWSYQKFYGFLLNRKLNPIEILEMSKNFQFFCDIGYHINYGALRSFFPTILAKFFILFCVWKRLNRLHSWIVQIVQNCPNQAIVFNFLN